MNLSTDQTDQINKEIDILNINLSSLQTGVHIGSARLEKLYKAEFHIERLIIDGQLIEQAIKILIRSYETKRRIVKIAGKPDPYRSIQVADFEDQTLGYLIKLLSKFTGSHTLISKLWKFNNKRTDITHHIFDGKFDDLTQLDTDTDEYLNSIEFNSIILELLERTLKFSEETKKLLGL